MFSPWGRQGSHCITFLGLKYHRKTYFLLTEPQQHSCLLHCFKIKKECRNLLTGVLFSINSVKLIISSFYIYIHMYAYFSTENFSLNLGKLFKNVIRKLIVKLLNFNSHISLHHISKKLYMIQIKIDQNLFNILYYANKINMKIDDEFCDISVLQNWIEVKKVLVASATQKRVAKQPKFHDVLELHD